MRPHSPSRSRTRAAPRALRRQPNCSQRCSRPPGNTGPAQAVSYTVRSGDSLSSIAGRFYHKQNAWPVLYWANHSKVRWANVLGVGQVLKIPAKPAKIPAAPGALGPAAGAAPPGSPRPPGRPGVRTRAGRARGGEQLLGRLAGGSFGQCVIARESGGNSQVMNSSGHYGLYQFSESTWVGIRRFGRRLRARQRGRAEPGVRQRTGAGRAVQLVRLRRLLTGWIAPAGPRGDNHRGARPCVPDRLTGQVYRDTILIQARSGEGCPRMLAGRRDRGLRPAGGGLRRAARGQPGRRPRGRYRPAH